MEKGDRNERLSLTRGVTTALWPWSLARCDSDATSWLPSRAYQAHWRKCKLDPLQTQFVTPVHDWQNCWSSLAWSAKVQHCWTLLHLAPRHAFWRALTRADGAVGSINRYAVNAFSRIWEARESATKRDKALDAVGSINPPWGSVIYDCRVHLCA